MSLIIVICRLVFFWVIVNLLPTIFKLIDEHIAYVIYALDFISAQQ
jgi:hypothetical protein